MKMSMEREMFDIKRQWSPEILFWLKDVFHIYQLGHVENVALQNVSIQIKRGIITGIQGPSGAGKSTFLNILAGFLTPTAGRVYFKPEDDHNEIYDLSRLDISTRTAYRREYVGFVAQEFNIFPYLTVEENVDIPLLLQERNPKDFKDQKTELLELCGIEHLRENKATDLSGGERQRATIVMALIKNPAVVLTDEPTGNLDTKSTRAIFELFRKLNKQLNTSFIVVSHNPVLEEYCDELIQIEDGILTMQKNTQ